MIQFVDPYQSEVDNMSCEVCTPSAAVLERDAMRKLFGRWVEPLGWPYGSGWRAVRISEERLEYLSREHGWSPLPSEATILNDPLDVVEIFGWGD